MIENIIFDFATVVALVIGLTEVVKKFKMPSNFYPLISLVLGVGMSFVAFTVEPIIQKVLLGITCGLTASGLFDNVRKVQETIVGK